MLARRLNLQEKWKISLAVFSAEFKATDQTTLVTCRDWEIRSLENHPAAWASALVYIVLVIVVCLTRGMTITRSYCCHGVRGMQNLIEFMQGEQRER